MLSELDSIILIVQAVVVAVDDDHKTTFPDILSAPCIVQMGHEYNTSGLTDYLICHYLSCDSRFLNASS